MTNQTPGSSKAASKLDALMAELEPYLWLDRYETEWGDGSLEIRGRIRVDQEELQKLTSNAQAWDWLFRRAQEVIALLGDRLAPSPKLVIEGTTKDHPNWRSNAELTLSIRHGHY